MLGLMQDWPLLIPKIIDHAAKQHGTREVVTRSVEGPITRTDYATIRPRARNVAQRLSRQGSRSGARIATLAGTTARHLESWYGIPGAGAIYHAVNPRLFPEQIVWIVNHAEDRMVLVDLTFVPLLEAIASRLPSVERYIVLTDAAHMPKTTLKNAVAYEDWIAEVDGDFRWLELDERSAAGLCYTSGTTGDPKGVLYSHRSNVLHALAASQIDCLAISANTSILPIVPLFHANSWSIAFSAPMAGAKMVMPGPKLDGASVYELLEAEQVTCTAGVPTVWAMLLQYIEKEQKTFSTLKRLIVGGSAAPRAMIEAFEKRYGVEVIHAWGMTEMSPLGTVCSVKPAVSGLQGEALYDLKVKQGFTPFLIEMKITDDDGKELPWDGKTFGRLKVAGPAVVKAYYRGEGNVLDEEGFFDHGDRRPLERRDQIRRRMDFVDRSGICRLRPPRRGGGCRNRHPPSEVGRAAPAGGGTEARTDGR